MTDAADLTSRQVELEYKARLVEQECRNILDYTIRGPREIVFTLDATTVGVTSIGGPTRDVEHDGLLDYLEDVHGLTLDSFKVELPTDPGEAADVTPEDVGTDLSKNRADMEAIRRKWLRDQLQTSLVMQLASPDLQ